MRSPSRPGPLSRRHAIMVLLSTPGVLALSACATPPAPQPMIPPAARTPCRGPDPTAVKTPADLADFSIEQERALMACEAKRRALIGTIEKKPR